MRNQKIMLLLACVLISLLLVSCGDLLNSSGTGQTENNGTSDITDSSGRSDTVISTLAANGASHEDAADTVWNSSDVIPIVLNGSSITADSAGVTVSGTTATITAAGTYSLSGSLTNGQIVVKAKSDAIVRLILNGVNITNTTNSPIFSSKADKTVIILAEGTENVVSDGKTYVFADPNTTEPDAAIFSKTNLTIGGSGSLTVTGNYADGIACKDGLIIESGTLNVTSADDGIRGKDYLIVKGGKITVNAVGDGLKSTNDSDVTLGYVLVTGGKIDVTAGGDGISAETDAMFADGTINIISGGGNTVTIAEDASAKGIKAGVELVVDGGTFTIDSADDSLHSNTNVTINGGNITLATNDDAVHAESAVTVNDGTLHITKCVEGLEGALVAVNQGDIDIVASDDGMNATYGDDVENNDGSCLYIHGGKIYINALIGDGVDSNGNILMTGGTLIIDGPQSQPEVAVDCNGTFAVNGGLFVATGPNSGNMIETPSTSSTQCCLKATCTSMLSASTLFHIQNASGTDIVTFKPAKKCYYLLVSSPDLVKGSSYSIYTGGSSTGTIDDGLYSGGTYSGGTLKKSFTISKTITSVSF